MLQIECSGTPYEIGHTHGSLAKEAIIRTIAFYTWMFQDSAKMSWPRVRSLALEFEPIIQQNWPAYLEEMRGISSGSGLPLADIIAINVRTEITFGLFSDGCTALAWGSWLAQNWDWNPRQGENVIMLSIRQEGKPAIKMMTEAGLIGKIGLNEKGVGVCLNAIKAKGMDRTRVPCHLGLRMVLESGSREEAVRKLEATGVASACHMLIADPTGSVGLEWSSVGVKKLEMNEKGQIFHSNHYLAEHEGVEDTNWLEDSQFRVQRIEELCKEVGGEVGFEGLREVFKDEKNWPGAICRKAEGKSTSETLFNIIMELDVPRARVKMGRPNGDGEELELSFGYREGQYRRSALFV